MNSQSPTPAPESATPAPGRLTTAAGESSVPAPRVENGASSDDLTASLLEAISAPTAPEADPQSDAVEPPADAPEAAPDGPAAEDAEAGTYEESLTDPEPEADEASEVTNLPKGLQKRFSRYQRKIDALKAQLDGAGELREERDALKAKLAALESQAPHPAEAADPVPVGLSATEAKIQREIDQKAGFVADLDEALAVAQSNGDPEITISEGEKSVKLPVRQARLLRAKFAAEQSAKVFALEQAQAQLAQNMDQMYREAVTTHPWLKDTANPDTQRIQETLREFPWLKSMRGVVGIMADAAAYRRGKAAPAKAAAAPAPAQAKVPQRMPGRPAAAPAAQPTGEGQARVKFARYMEKGESSDLASVLPDLVERRT